MGMIVLAGRDANILARGTVTVSDENASFPKAQLWDGDPGNIFAFATASADRSVVVDCDLALGTGDFEAVHVGGAPPGWTNASTGTGSLTRDTVTFADGTSSCRMNSGASGQGVLQREYRCRAGEALTISMKIRGDGLSPCTAVLQDLETGEFLNSSGNFVSGFTTFESTSSTLFQTRTRTVTVTAMSYWPQAIRRLRLRFLSAAANGAQAWVDTFFFAPKFDTLGVFGHNVRLADVTLKWQAGDTAGFSNATDLAVITPRRDKFYNRLSSPSGQRYTRLLAEGLNVEPIWYGELVIGASRLFSRVAVSPIETTHIDHRVSIPRLVGGTAARGLARSLRRVKSLVFQFPDTPGVAESGLWREWQDEVLLRSLGGHPALIVPTTDREEVLFCRLPESVREADGNEGRRAGHRSTDALELDELALPVELP